MEQSFSCSPKRHKLKGIPGDGQKSIMLYGEVIQIWNSLPKAAGINIFLKGAHRCMGEGSASGGEPFLHWEHEASEGQAQEASAGECRSLSAL